ncbi:GspH/FimT family pseudopilin [Nitrincola schmidtii]|uniref:GspH/FimT family pseudopilin n=1 Tax=Nitrincola schmidtii TaxID=1730894 RepID=UPI00124BF250|nr:GspH/FimT family pseudopilin [Nitrincola schmidtii]
MGHKDYQSGFSLLELMTAIVILVILATVAVPSFSALVEQTRQETAAEQLRTHLALARIESVTRQEWVTICRSNDQQTCVGDALTGATEWSGLIMFVDHDRNRLPTKPEDVIRVTTFKSQVTVYWNRGDSLTYQPDGSVTGFSNGTFSIHAGNPEKEYRLILSMSGRVREEIK